MDYTERIPDEGEPMEEKRTVIGTLVSLSGQVRWVTDVVKLADYGGYPIPGVGFLTTDPIALVNGLHDPVTFDNGHGKMFLIMEQPLRITCYVLEEQEGEPTPDDISYVNTTLDVTYQSHN